MHSPFLLIKELAASGLVPITATFIVNALIHDANFASLRVEHPAAAQIEPHMLFILGIRGAFGNRKSTAINSLHATALHCAQSPL